MHTTPAPRAALWLSCAALLLCPSRGLADRAILALEQTISGQSNLFRTDSDEEADGSYQVQPSIRLQRSRGEIQYELDYAPTYDVFFRTDGIDGFDQFGKAELSYAPTPLGTLYTRSDFAYYRSIRSNTVDGPSGSPEVVPDVSGRVFRALSDFGYEHSFSATTVGTASFGLQAYDYTTPNNTDSIGVGGGLRLLHQLGQTVELGGLLLATHRRFEDQDFEPASSNTILHAGPIVRVVPYPTYTIEVEFGPAWVLTDRDSGEGGSVSQFRTEGSGAGLQGAAFVGCGQFAGQPLLSECPLVPAGGAASQLDDQNVSVDFAPGLRPASQDDDRLTGFGRLLLRKDMYWGYLSLAYLRAEDASSGNGATTVRDSLTATAWFGSDETWSLRWRANWNQRETVDEIDDVAVVAGPSAVPVPFGGGITFAEAEGLVVTGDSRPRTTQFWTDVTLRRPLTDLLSIEVGGRYLLQERSHGGVDEDGGDYDNWRGNVMLRVELPGLDYGW